MKRNVMLKISMILLATPTMAFATGLAKSFTFDGILKDNTDAVIAAPTAVKFQILSPANCLLYEELQTIDPDDTDGSFVTQIGSDVGNPNRTGSDPGNAWHVVFQNSTTINSPGCSGGIYTPATGDARKLRVIVGVTTLAPDFVLRTAPTATVAETLQGKGANEFLMVKDDTPTDLSQTNLETAFSSTNWPKLQNLFSATNNGGMVGVPTSAVSFNGQVLNNVAAPATGTDATNKTYVDGRIGGSTLDLAGLSNGQVLTWDSVNSKWIASNPSAVDSSKLPLVGGTMTGTLNMGSQNISNVGNMTISAQGSLRMGQFTLAEESTFVSSVLTPGGTGMKGTTWYETTNNKMRVWNGSAAVDVGGAGGAGDFMKDGTVAMTGPVQALPGGAASPGITFSGDLDTGIASPIVNNVSLVTGGMDRLLVDSMGNVGIGTTSPTPGAVLDLLGITTANSSMIVPRATTGTRPSSPVDGMIRYNTTLAKFEAYENGAWINMITAAGGLPAADTVNFSELMDSMTLDASTDIAASGSFSLSVTNTGTAHSFIVNDQAADATPFVIDQNGNVGIGTSAPSDKLFVAGGLTTQALTVTPTALPGGAVGKLVFDSGDSNKLKFHDGTSWQTVGVAGAGVTSVTAGAGLTGGTITASGTIGIANSGITAAMLADATVARAGGNTDAAPLTVGTNDNFPIIFESNNTEKMRLDGSGKLGIGVTAPQVDLHVSNPAGARVMIEGPNAASGTAKAGMMITNFANTYAGSGSHPTLWLRNARGNSGVPTTTQSGDILGLITAEGYSGGFLGGAGLSFLARQPFSGSAAGTAISFKTVKNNTIAPVEAMRIEESGFVGIGTTFPAAPLDVETVSGAQPVVLRLASMGAANKAQIVFEDVTTTMPARIGGVGDGFAINTNNMDQLVVTPTGNVGIGTTSPMAKLVVNGTILGKEQVVPSGSGVDFSIANTFILQSVGGSTITIVNPNVGGKYTIIVEDTTARTYTISGCSTAYYSPTNAITSQRTVYNIHYVAGNKCYIDWKTGYQ